MEFSMDKPGMIWVVKVRHMLLSWLKSSGGDLWVGIYR